MTPIFNRVDADLRLDTIRRKGATIELAHIKGFELGFFKGALQARHPIL
jgi:hypothetical protein